MVIMAMAVLAVVVFAAFIFAMVVFVVAPIKNLANKFEQEWDFFYIKRYL